MTTLFVCLVLWVGSFPAPAAPAHLSSSGEQSTPVLDGVTIRLKDGREFSPAKITIDPTYLTLTVVGAEGQVHNVSYEMVESIKNAQGEDITKRVIGDYALVPAEGAVEAQPDASGPQAGFQPKRLPWRVGLTVAPTYSFPFGDWYEGIQSDLGVRGVLSIGVHREVTLDFTFQHQPVGVEGSYLQQIESQLSAFLGATVDIRDYKLSLEKFLGSVRYMAKARNSPLWGYSSFGMGVISHRSDISFLVNGQAFQADDTLNEFVMNSAGGAVYMFSSHVGIDVGANFDLVFGTVEGMSGVSYGFLFELQGGLALAF